MFDEINIIGDQLEFIILSILVFFLSFDIGLIIIINKRNPTLSNNYYKFSLKWGIYKAIAIKIIIGFIFYLIIIANIPDTGVKLFLPAIVYAYFVVGMLLDFLKNRKSNNGL